jgi:hypothetical protein
MNGNGTITQTGQNHNYYCNYHSTSFRSQKTDIKSPKGPFMQNNVV